MDVVDWIIVAILLFGAWEGYRTGFIRQIVRLFGTLIAYVAAWQLGSFVSPYLYPFVHGTLLKNVKQTTNIPIVGMLATGSTVTSVAHAISGALAFGITFFIVLILVRYLGRLLSAVFSLPVLNFANRVIGLLVGGVVAALLIAVLINVGSYLPASSLKTQLSHSLLAPLFAQPVATLAKMEGITLPKKG
nr:CvpA family protein [Bacilli bacterium]